MQQRILIISWSVYPVNQAMSIVVNNLAKSLGPNNVVVVGEKSNVKDTWDSIDYPLYYVDPGIPNIFKGKNYHKWISLFSVIKKVEKIAIQHKCTAILCPFPDEFYLATAYFVSKKTRLPFYPWFHNTYLENRKGLKLILAKILQPKIFKRAKTVLTISEGLTQFYKRKYKDVSFLTLLHGFILPEENTDELLLPKYHKIKFAYTGSFNESCREASIRLCKVIIDNPNYELHIFGKSTAEQLSKEQLDLSNVQIYGFLNEIEFLSKLRQCHTMLLPHGFTGKWNQVEFNTIFPTRTIPLLYSGRPILLHSPKNVFLTNFFLSNECGLVLSDSDENSLKESINNFVKDLQLQEKLVKNAIKVSKMYDVHQTVKHLNELIAFDN